MTKIGADNHRTEFRINLTLMGKVYNYGVYEFHI
jgi:hypothetical protein